MISHSTQPGSPVVEITVEGAITNKELEEAIKGLLSGFDQNGKTRVIEIIQHFTGMELAALWTDIRLGVPLARKIDRVAVVADQKWIRQFAQLGQLFTRAELKVFAPAELAQARAWIAANWRPTIRPRPLSDAIEMAWFRPFQTFLAARPRARPQTILASALPQ